MQKKGILLFIVIINLVIAGGIITYIESTRTKTYYIDLNKVYNEFELKKELEKKLEAFVSISNEALDSLEMQAKIINNDLQQSPSDQSKLQEYNILAQRYASKTEEFDMQKIKVAEEYDQQVWAQLNEYIIQYGKERNCDFIIAGNGDGSIMYAKSSKDITEKMILYVNEKYQGE